LLPLSSEDSLLRLDSEREDPDDEDDEDADPLSLLLLPERCWEDPKEDDPDLEDEDEDSLDVLFDELSSELSSEE